MDRTTYILVPVLLAILVLLNVLSFQEKSLTFDEPWHFRYGSKILNGNADRFVDGTMPVSALNALPKKMADLAKTPGHRNLLATVETGRYVTVLFSLLTALFVFRWARELYGRGAGLFSLTLYVLSPTVIAHSRLITTDLYAAGMAVISTYYFWRFLKTGGWKPATVSAVMLGLAQLTKYACLLLYLIFFALVVIRYAGDLLRMARAGDAGGVARYIKRFLVFAVFFALVVIVIINLGFVFDNSLTPFEQYEFRSETFKNLQTGLGALGGLPVPLPYAYLEGLDWGKYREESGKGFGSMYLFGELREIGGFKGYYFFAFLFKVPIAVQIFIVLAVVFYVIKRKRYRFMENELFLLGPIVFLAVYFNFFFRLQIGIRHFLIAFPFIYVFCGSLVSRWDQWSRKLRALTVLLLAYLAVSVLSYFPHYIPYFNELVWDRKQGYKILADSNIDWGQDRIYLREYEEAHPGAYVEKGEWRMKRYREKHRDELLNPQFPDSGKIVVGVNHLVGLHMPERFKWLRDNYEPVDHIAYSYLVFDLSAGEERAKAGKSPEDLKRRLDQLRSVPYTTFTDSKVDESTSGVVIYETDKTYDGYNIYCSRTDPEAYLMDMSGRIVKTWSYPDLDADVWDHVVFVPGGDLLVIEKYTSLARLDWNSNLVWRWKLAVHHDVVPLDDGSFYAIKMDMRQHRGFVVRFPSFIRLGADGKEIDSWSTYDHLDELRAALDRRSFLDTILDSLLDEGYTLDTINRVPGRAKTRQLKHGRKLYDYFHPNTITILPDTPLGRRDPRFRAGNIMICLRHVNQIAIIDRDTKDILWAWGEGELEWPHHPTMLDNGNILIYDNGIYRKFTRILELDPVTATVKWEYAGDPPESFYSEQKGSAQRLPNGNTLICDADNGRAFEITPVGEIVWEWLNPATKEGRRVQLYRMIRLEPGIVDPLME